MNLSRCSQGHFYDAGIYNRCPHCNAGPSEEANNETRALDIDQADVTVGLQEAVKNATASMGASQQAQPLSAAVVDDDPKTVGFFKSSMGIEPVVGWLVSVEGANKGKDFRLKSGRNFIGRSSQMDVCLSGDNTVSRDRHGILVYEPKNHLFLISPGDSKELCYLNDDVVLTPQTIAKNDILTVGSTKLMFFPCCDGVFNWGQDAQPAKD